ncbi:MAG: glycosyltransferase [Anaerolineae bacterium]
MEILHIYKDYHPVLGGIENHVKWLAEQQASAGHTVTVLACAPGLRSQIGTLNGVRVVKAGRLATVASMPISLSLPWILSRLTPDIAHVHSPFPLGETANYLLGRARATVITYHSDIVRQRGWLRLYGPLLRRVLRAADCIIATSPRYLETSPWLKDARDRCVVIPLGVDVNRFAPSADPRGAHRPSELLFVGRLRYYKGLDVLLQAMTRLPEAHLTIVGDGPMRATWQAMASSLGISSQITWAGEVPDKALPGYYARSDLFILPAIARAEAFGTVLLEAMASGLPVISTELGTGTSWVNQHQVTGLVVPPGDPEALAAAIRELLDAPERREAMGRAARARVEADFSFTAMAQRIESAYQLALERAATRPGLRPR